jgi:hypothetical protein
MPEEAMPMSRPALLILSGLLLAAAVPAGAQVYYPAAPAYEPAAQPYDEGSTAPGPWYVDPEELGPLYAWRDDRSLPLWAYPGDEDATDFANRYGCAPVWDGALNRYVPACNPD